VAFDQAAAELVRHHQLARLGWLAAPARLTLGRCAEGVATTSRFAWPSQLCENPNLTAYLGSALIAHLSVGDGPESWGWAAGTGVLWGLSYFFRRRLQAAPASA